MREGSGSEEAVIKISNAKWASAEEARFAVEEAGLAWGGIGSWEDMVFRRKRSRNLQTLTADAVLSVKVGEVLKGLLMGNGDTSNWAECRLSSHPPPGGRCEKNHRTQAVSHHHRVETLARVGQGSSTTTVSHSTKRNGARSAEKHVESMENSRSYRTRPRRSPGAGGLDIKSGAPDPVGRG